MHKHLHGRWIFADDANFGVLEGRVGRGAAVKATPLTEEFDYAAYRERYGTELLPMMLITSDNKLDVIVADEKIDPQPGQTVVSLVFEPVESEQA